MPLLNGSPGLIHVNPLAGESSASPTAALSPVVPLRGSTSQEELPILVKEVLAHCRAQESPAGFYSMTTHAIEGLQAQLAEAEAAKAMAQGRVATLEQEVREMEATCDKQAAENEGLRAQLAKRG